MVESIVKDKSKDFALKIIQLYKFLTVSAPIKEFVLSKQILRSGTSIGANIKEALRAQSRPDFKAKMNIALKEASETEYWLELLYESDYINDTQYEYLIDNCRELLKLLTSIVKNTN